MAEELTTTIYFDWESVMPDRRQYKQNATVLKLSDTRIAVLIPLTSEYIFNYEKLVVAQVDSNSNLVEPILTPVGMRYCIDKLEEVLIDEHTDKLTSENEDWSNSVEDGEVKNTTPADDWGAEFDTDEGDAGKADEELWECSEEDWK